jgi:hypothetical protein
MAPAMPPAVDALLFDRRQAVAVDPGPGPTVAGHSVASIQAIRDYSDPAPSASYPAAGSAAPVPAPGAEGDRLHFDRDNRENWY